MSTDEATSLLDGAIIPLGSTLSGLTFDSMFAVATFFEAREEWKERVEALKDFSRKSHEKTGKEAYRRMWSRLITHDARVFPPKPVVMDPHGGQDEELLAELEENLNRQCNWLFVTAFEAYERCLKSLYATAGHLDRSFWVCSDFGEISAGELGHLPAKWFMDQVERRRARITPNTILSRFRTVLPQMRDHEDRHPLDLRMWVGTAAHFRHMVVHNSGLAPKDTFWDDLAKETGYSFTGCGKETVSRKYWVSKHLEDKIENYSVTMIDRTGLAKKGPRVDTPLDSMLVHLSSHALLIYSLLAERFQFKPYWEREERPQPPAPHEAPADDLPSGEERSPAK